MPVDWSAHFVWYEQRPPAKKHALAQLLSSLRAPLTSAEIAALSAREQNPFPVGSADHRTWCKSDPSRWRMPSPEVLPADWCSLLSFSNGGHVGHDEMEFQFLGTSEVREYFLAYGFQKWMPEAVPLGLDGSGSFVVLDVRNTPVDREYPVLLVSAGALGFDEADTLGANFAEFISWRVRLEAVRER